jgi:transcriptional regulator with XRE-family HTH domain
MPSMDEAHPLRKWRDAKSKTLADLAGLLGVEPSHLSMVENDKRGVSYELAQKLAAITEGEIPVELAMTWKAERDAA